MTVISSSLGVVTNAPRTRDWGSTADIRLSQGDLKVDPDHSQSYYPAVKLSPHAFELAYEQYLMDGVVGFPDPNSAIQQIVISTVSEEGLDMAGRYLEWRTVLEVTERLLKEHPELLNLTNEEILQLFCSSFDLRCDRLPHKDLKEFTVRGLRYRYSENKGEVYFVDGREATEDHKLGDMVLNGNSIQTLPIYVPDGQNEGEGNIVLFADGGDSEIYHGVRKTSGEPRHLDSISVEQVYAPGADQLIDRSCDNEFISGCKFVQH